MYPTAITALTSCLIAIVASFPGNIFILIVIIQDLTKNRRLRLNEQLIAGICVFNLLNEFQKFYRYCVLILNGNVLKQDQLEQIGFGLLLSLSCCSLWFSTWLSIHFCLKIVNINHRWYIFLQRIFSVFFPWMILPLVVGYFLLGFRVALDLSMDCPLNGTIYFSLSSELSDKCFWSFKAYMAECLLCFFLCSVSALTIIISLIRHIKRIQDNAEGSGTFNVRSHIRVVKTVTSLLGCNALLFTSIITSVTRGNDVNWIYVRGFGTSICHIFSAYFLIKGTKKLDIALGKLLIWLPCSPPSCIVTQQ